MLWTARRSLVQALDFSAVFVRCAVFNCLHSFESAWAALIFLLIIQPAFKLWVSVRSFCVECKDFRETVPNPCAVANDPRDQLVKSQMFQKKLRSENKGWTFCNEALHGTILKT